MFQYVKLLDVSLVLFTDFNHDNDEFVDTNDNTPPQSIRDEIICAPYLRLE